MRIELGKRAKDCLKVVDKKVSYKRSMVEYRAGRGTLEIKITASDPIALVSSLNAAIKQLRIITSVDKTVSRLVAEDNGTN